MIKVTHVSAHIVFSDQLLASISVMLMGYSSRCGKSQRVLLDRGLLL